MLAFAVLAALVLLRLGLVAVAALLLIHPVRECPACFAGTIPILRPWLRRSSRYEWRWCPACGWQGPARRTANASAYSRSTTISESSAGR
ncbi:MAG: hypothetical protein ACRELD_05980 [Longimicrobiales bacterium]